MGVKGFGFFTTIALGFCFLAGLPTRVYADVFDISWSSAAFGSGSATANAINEGSGTYLLTSFVTGTQAGLPITLLPPGTYGENHNDIYPSEYPQLDNNGFAFSDGVNDYNVFWAPTVTAYYECSSAQSSCIGLATDVGHPLTSFSITAVPEPGAIWLIAAVSIGLMRTGLRRKRRG